MFAVNCSVAFLSGAVKTVNLDAPSLLILNYYKRRMCFNDMGRRHKEKAACKLMFRMLSFVYQLKEEVER